MKNQPNKATVKDGLPTAERILNDHLWMGTEPTGAQSAILAAMQSYSDQQNAELREQLADLERENNNYRLVYDSVVKNRDDLRERVKELEATVAGYKECFEHFMPESKWDEATAFLSSYGNGLAKDFQRKERQ